VTSSAQRLHLLEQDLKGLRMTRIGVFSPLTMAFVGLHAPDRVSVGLAGEHLAAFTPRVRLERHHLHSPKALPPNWRLAAQRRLGERER